MPEYLLLRVLIDTNVWISSFINPSGPPAHVLRLLAAGKYTLIMPAALMAEIQDVLTRPRVRRSIRMTDDEIVSGLRQFERNAITVTPTGSLRLCRDPKDDFLLETAILGKADYIISRDDDIKRDLDLFIHLREHGVEVLSVAQFLNRLAE